MSPRAEDESSIWSRGPFSSEGEHYPEEASGISVRENPAGIMYIDMVL